MYVKYVFEGFRDQFYTSEQLLFSSQGVKTGSKLYFSGY